MVLLTPRAVRACLGILGLAIGLMGGGCASNKPTTINPDQPFQFPGTTESGAAPETSTTGAAKDVDLVPETKETNNIWSGRVLRIGEKVNISFSDLPAPGLMPHEQRIREDGTITLPYNITVQAAGKTAGQLENDIRAEYVPKLYLRMTVTVRSEERFYFVGGEVKLPGRQPYLGDISVLRAIQTAGDFTDFANRKKIELIRTDGDRFMINWAKAVKDPKLDLEVFPGDQIIVHRRWF